MEETKKIHSEDNSFRNAHILSEFSEVLSSIANEMGNSVTLFDSIGEKNEMFVQFEESLKSPVESLIEMNKISKRGIYDFVFNNFVNIFRNHKERFNFIHVGKIPTPDIVFFISTKDDEIKEILSKNEFEYATGDLSNYLRISFCFLEPDMEGDLSNTEKIDLDNAKEIREQSKP